MTENGLMGGYAVVGLFWVLVVKIHLNAAITGEKYDMGCPLVGYSECMLFYMKITQLLEKHTVHVFVIKFIQITYLVVMVAVLIDTFQLLL